MMFALVIGRPSSVTMRPLMVPVGKGDGVLSLAPAFWPGFVSGVAAGFAVEGTWASSRTLLPDTAKLMSKSEARMRTTTRRQFLKRGHVSLVTRFESGSLFTMILLSL